MRHRARTRVAAMLAVALAVTGCARGSAPLPAGGAPMTAPPATVPLPTAVPAPVPVHALLAYATDTEVWVLPRGGRPRRVASGLGDLRDVEVSADGRHVAWVAYLRTRAASIFGVYDVVAGTSREWRSPGVDAQSLAATSDAFVTVDSGEAARLLRFDPHQMLRGGEPRATALRGVRYARLLTAARGRVLVAASESADRGETVFDVAADGTTTPLFRDDAPLPKGDFHRLPILAAALTADGRRLVHGTGIRGSGSGDECHLDYGAAVRDLSTGRAVRTAAVPTLGDDVFTLVRSVTTGADGRTVVGFSTEMQSCGGQPLRGAAYAVDAGRWTLVARGAVWAASGPDGSLATISAEGVLAVGRHRVASGVRLASWSPV